MPSLMVAQDMEKINTEMDAGTRVFHAFSTLGIASMLKQSNIRNDSRKLKGEKDSSQRSAYAVFTMLFLLVFQGFNLFRYLHSKKGDSACSKNTYYRFLDNCHYNWRRFLTLLSSKVIARIDPLTDATRVKCFVLDDSVHARGRSKKVELLAWVFDHTIGKCVKGFNLLLLGWTDGYSFIPVGFTMLSSAAEKNRLVDADERIDKRSNGWKRREEALLPKTDAAIMMLKEAINAGIQAAYVLMDTWFTNEPFIRRIKEFGLEVIGMLKDTKQQYWYHGRLMNLRQLAGLVRFDTASDIFGSVTVKTKFSLIPVKLVFVRNRNKRDEYIIILSTDLSLSDAEIIRIYGNRWSIECCFKVCKSLLKLGKEFHGISFDMTVSSAAIVFARFIILEWLRREDCDPRTAGELFFMVYDEVRDMELSQALKALLEIVASGLRDGSIHVSETIRVQLVEWFFSQPRFIQALFPAFLSDSGLVPEAAPIPCQ